ncbi:MAG: RluA family pseudouridine synthase [Oliverpabstia sp.]
MKEIIIGKNEAGQRMDKYLKKYFRSAGSGFLYKMLRKKNILLNRKKAEGKEMLAEGDTITLYLSDDTIEKFRKIPGENEEEKEIYPCIPLDILYEDENFIIVNKPAGILSQKASPNDDSMVEYLTGYLLEQNQITRTELETFHPSVCNRLDRNTSGLILAGKSLAGLQDFSELLKKRSMKKYYLALVQGRPEQSGRYRAWLKKNVGTNQVKVIKKPCDGAAMIETGYEVLWSNGSCSLLKVDLITGKSHQIRCHLASLGYPLAGDTKYGNAVWNQKLRKTSGLNRQFLHAWQVCFPQLNGRMKPLSEKTFMAPLPEDLKKTLEQENASGIWNSMREGV